MPHVPRALCVLVPNVPRALCTLELHLPLALRASCPTCSRALRASCSTCSRGPRPSCHTCSFASRAYCPLCSSASRALCLTCLVPYVASCFAFYEPFLLTTVFHHILYTLCPNIIFCALEFPCITVQFFCSFAAYDFLGKLTKVKTNIVSQYQQYDIFEQFETKYENIYKWNCKLLWYRGRWI